MVQFGILRPIYDVSNIRDAFELRAQALFYVADAIGLKGAQFRGGQQRIGLRHRGEGGDAVKVMAGKVWRKVFGGDQQPDFA